MSLLFDAIVKKCDAMPMPVTLAEDDRDEFPLVYVNAAFTSLTGYDRSFAVGQSCRFLQGPETDRTVPQVIRQRLMLGESACSILTNYRKSGERFQNFLIIEPLVSLEKRHLLIGFQYELRGQTQKSDLSLHINRVGRAETSLGCYRDDTPDHLLTALSQKSDAALLALKILTANTSRWPD
ncbi:MAG: PAS domain-containing protein [Pseudomonadota bacterium]